MTQGHQSSFTLAHSAFVPFQPISIPLCYSQKYQYTFYQHLHSVHIGWDIGTQFLLSSHLFILVSLELLLILIQHAGRNPSFHPIFVPHRLHLLVCNQGSPRCSPLPFSVFSPSLSPFLCVTPPNTQKETLIWTPQIQYRYRIQSRQQQPKKTTFT